MNPYLPVVITFGAAATVIGMFCWPKLIWTTCVPLTFWTRMGTVGPWLPGGTIAKVGALGLSAYGWPATIVSNYCSR